MSLNNLGNSTRAELPHATLPVFLSITHTQPTTNKSGSEADVDALLFTDSPEEGRKSSAHSASSIPPSRPTLKSGNVDEESSVAAALENFSSAPLARLYAPTRVS